jgi:hypothetical protein
VAPRGRLPPPGTDAPFHLRSPDPIVGCRRRGCTPFQGARGSSHGRLLTSRPGTERVNPGPVPARRPRSAHSSRPSEPPRRPGDFPRLPGVKGSRGAQGVRYPGTGSQGTCRTEGAGGTRAACRAGRTGRHGAPPRRSGSGVRGGPRGVAQDSSALSAWPWSPPQTWPNTRSLTIRHDWRMNQGGMDPRERVRAGGKPTSARGRGS